MDHLGHPTAAANSCYIIISSLLSSSLLPFNISWDKTAVSFYSWSCNDAVIPYQGSFYSTGWVEWSTFGSPIAHSSVFAVIIVWKLCLQDGSLGHSEWPTIGDQWGRLSAVMFECSYNNGRSARARQGDTNSWSNARKQQRTEAGAGIIYQCIHQGHDIVYLPPMGKG